MSRIKTITKYFIKNSIDNIFSSKRIKTGTIAGIIFLIMFCLSIPLCFIVKYLFEPLKRFNQQGTILLLLFFIGVLIAFLFGVYTIMNVFYFSDDIEHFLPIPIKSKELVIGKFISVYINMMIYSSVLVMPLIVYGYLAEAEVIYYIYILPIILLLPILPMVISSILCMVLMRFTIFFKNKDLLKIIAGCISLALVIVFNILTSGENIDDSVIVNSLLKGNQGVIEKISGILITNKFMTYSLLKHMSLNGLTYLIITIIINIGLFLAFYLVGSKVYLKSIIGLVENNRNRIDVFSKNSYYVQHSARRALVFKDIKFILRTPHLFLNCIAMQLYVPIAMIAFLFATSQFYSLRNFISDNNAIYSKILVIVFVMVGFFISVGGAGVTAISRDGIDFAVNKYIPVDFRLQIKAKIVSSVLINQLTTLEIGILLLIFSGTLKIVLLSMLVSFVTVILVTLFGIFIDVKSPNLTWRDEKNLTKGNYFSLVILIIMIIMGILLFLLTNKVNSVGLIFVLIILIDTVLSKLLYNGIIIFADRLYKQ